MLEFIQRDHILMGRCKGSGMKGYLLILSRSSFAIEPFAAIFVEFRESVIAWISSWF